MEGQELVIARGCPNGEVGAQYPQHIGSRACHIPWPRYELTRMHGSIHFSISDCGGWSTAGAEAGSPAVQPCSQ